MDAEMKPALEECMREAGAILMKSFGHIHARDINTKPDESVVTKADMDSEKAIVEIIRSKFPKHNIIAEETGFLDNKSEYTWVVDPLDGTSNFAAGIPWFGVLIAVMKKAEPVLAGAYLPFYNQAYTAEKGRGAFMNGSKISASTEKELRAVLFSYCLDPSKDSEKIAMESRLFSLLANSIRNLRTTNSAVDECYVADGRLGGCINLMTKIWDIAAPWLIIREAGGAFTMADGSEVDFSFNGKNYMRNFPIATAGKNLHPKIIRMIKEAEK
jgi:myo-inositol-1(or 4)-monophosphatase